MKKTNRLFLAFAACAAFMGVAQANPVEKNEAAQQHAKAIFEVAQKKIAANPTTHFEKWDADIWTLAARHCGHEAGVSIPSDLGEALKTSAAWTSPHHGACGQLAALSKKESIAPVCTHVQSQEPPFGKPYEGLYNSYLFVDNAANGKLPSGEIEHVAVVKCLMANEAHFAPQYYKGNVQLNIDKPEQTKIAEAGQIHDLIAANATVVIPGLKDSKLTTRVLSKN